MEVIAGDVISASCGVVLLMVMSPNVISNDYCLTNVVLTE